MKADNIAGLCISLAQLARREEVPDSKKMHSLLAAGGSAYALGAGSVRPTRSHNVRMAAEPPHVAVVGGGWGGWSAATAASRMAARVTGSE